MRFEHWFYTLPLRLRMLFRRTQADLELEEELRDYIERQTEANIARGMSPEEAHRAAMIAMGGMEQRKQQCRETRGIGWLDDLGRDLLYGLRSMRRNPGFTLTALLILAIGIGANTAILSTDEAVLFRKLPYRRPAQLVEVFQKSVTNTAMDTMPVAPANYFDWKSYGSSSFESLAAWQETSLNLSGGDQPERVRAAMVTANLFEILGVQPVLGRTFRPNEDEPGKGTGVVLSYSVWQRRFQSDREIVGKRIRAATQIYTVIGVMPQSFRFPIGWESSDVEVWTPLAFGAEQRSDRKDISLEVLARLRPGITLAQGEASLATLALRLSKTYPETDKEWAVNLIPLADRGVSDFRRLFVFLSIAVGLVLLIACTNVASLLLARGMERQQELSIRTALGARRGRLVRQLMTEGVLLALAGGLLGIGIGYVGIRMLSMFAPAMELPELKHLTLHLQVLGAALVLSVLTGLLFSVLPALMLSRRSLHGAMQEAGRGSAGTIQGHRLKAALVVGEVALTLALLMCAGDILNSFYNYMRIDPGFDIRDVLVMRLALPQKKYSQPQQQAEFFKKAVEEIGAIPGVTAVAAGSAAPLEEAPVFWFHAEGSDTVHTAGGNTGAEYFHVTPDYFRATGIPLIHGRGLLLSDRDGHPRVAVVNEALARKVFGNADPIGKRIFLDGDINASAGPQASGPPIEIVGVVRDTKDYSLYQATPPMIFAPVAQAPESSASLVVKTALPAAEIVPEIRARIAHIDPDQPVYRVRTMKEIFRDFHAFFVFNTLLLTVFAAMALVLSMIGIYGVISYNVSQRTREFGIRLALGAPRERILIVVMGQSAWVSMAGILIGAALAWPATRLLSRTLKESMFLTLTHTGPLLFPALGVGMALVMLLAAIVPARRATRFDPMQALRCE